MHRVLVVRFGESFSEACEKLNEEYRERSQLGAVSAEVRFLRAPIEGVGNLSKPVEILKEKLDRELRTSLNQLLKMKPGSNDRFVFDIFFWGNVGEALVADAMTVVYEMLQNILEENYRTLFPPHQTGNARRVRVFPLLMSPAQRDLSRKRAVVLQELSSLRSFFLQEDMPIRGDDVLEGLVDRMFVVDSMLPSGGAQLDDLIAQVRNFLRFIIFAGARSDANTIQMLEYPVEDIVASIGCATCELDVGAVVSTLRHRFVQQVADALNAEYDSTDLPNPIELVSPSIVDDRGRRDSALAEIEALPIRALSSDGVAALPGLISLYQSCQTRTDDLQTLEIERRSIEISRESAVTTIEPHQSTLLLSIGTVALGAIAFALSFWVVLVVVWMALAIGSGVAILAWLVVQFAVRGREVAPERRPTQSSSQPESTHTAELPSVSSELDGVAGAIAKQLRLLTAFRFLLRDIDFAANDVLAPEQQDDNESDDESENAYIVRMTNERLLDALYKHAVASNSVAHADEFLQQLGSWEDLISGDIVPSLEELKAFSDNRFNAFDREFVFQSRLCRDALQDSIALFIDRWKNGIEPFIAFRAFQQFDPNAIIEPYRSTLFVPERLQSRVRKMLRDQESVSVSISEHGGLDDFYLLSVVVDLHQDAAELFREIE